jgi:hypothetical protein
MLVMDQESLQVLAYSTSPSAYSGIHAPHIRISNPQADFLSRSDQLCVLS